jgi:hypothetical protein
VRPAVVENTGDKLASVWADDGPRYGDVAPEDLDIAEKDPAGGVTGGAATDTDRDDRRN